jgi:hypothetical protein
MHSEGVLNMPKFRVKGCLKETAEDVEVIIEATSYKEAERSANKMGILVSDVLAAEEPSTKESTPLTTAGEQANEGTWVRGHYRRPSKEEKSANNQGSYQSPPRQGGYLSCPQCHSNAYGGRGCWVWGAVILFFPIGLLFLLIHPTYTCSQCRFKFRG